MANTDLQRNSGWDHLQCRDIISMPDKWEFPWVSTMHRFCCVVVLLAICFYSVCKFLDVDIDADITARVFAVM